MFMDITSRVFRFVEHNQGFFVAAALALCLAGCESLFPVRTASPLTGQPATIDELQQQLDSMYLSRDRQIAELQQQAEAAVRNLELFGAETEALEEQFAGAAETIEAKRAQRYQVLQTIASLAKATGVPGVETVAPLLLAGGLGWDNVRKELKIRKDRKTA